MKRFFYLDLNQVEQGPATAEELRRLDLKGAISGDTPVWEEGGSREQASTWDEVSRELAAGGSVAAAPAPNPPAEPAMEMAPEPQGGVAGAASEPAAADAGQPAEAGAEPAPATAAGGDSAVGRAADQARAGYQRLVEEVDPETGETLVTRCLDGLVARIYGCSLCSREAARRYSACGVKCGGLAILAFGLLVLVFSLVTSISEKSWAPLGAGVAFAIAALPLHYVASRFAALNHSLLNDLAPQRCPVIVPKVVALAAVFGALAVLTVGLITFFAALGSDLWRSALVVLVTAVVQAALLMHVGWFAARASELLALGVDPSDVEAADGGEPGDAASAFDGVLGFLGRLAIAIGTVVALYGVVIAAVRFSLHSLFVWVADDFGALVALPGDILLAGTASLAPLKAWLIYLLTMWLLSLRQR